MDKLNRFIKAVEYLKTKADKPTNEEVSRLLRYKTLSYISDVIGGSKPITDLLLDRMVEKSINKDWIETGKGQMVIENPKGITHYLPKALFIEIKSASGKLIQVKPDEQTNIPLLNALLEERDRVLEERNRTIEKIETQTQARIDELIKEKENLNKILNKYLTDISSSLTDVKEDAALGLAYQRAWVEYTAEEAAQGDKKKKDQVVLHMNKLLRSQIDGGRKEGKRDDARTQHKEGQ